MNKKIIIIIFGVLGRSLRFTHQNHHDNIFSPLSRFGINYDITYINNNIGDECIDGLPQDTNYMKIVQRNKYLELHQKDIDYEIEKTYPRYFDIFRSTNPALHNINPLRNSFIETFVGNHLLNSYSDHSQKALAFCSDCYFGRELDKSYVMSNDNKILSSDTNPACGGYTNGFYIGSILNVSKLMSNFNQFHGRQFYNYEHTLKHNATRHNLTIKQIRFRFIKIRNDKSVSYQLPGIPHTKCAGIISKFNNEV